MAQCIQNYARVSYGCIKKENKCDNINNLRLTDHIVILSDSKEMIEDLHRKSLIVGLKVNMKTTKVTAH